MRVLASTGRRRDLETGTGSRIGFGTQFRRKEVQWISC